MMEALPNSAGGFPWARQSLRRSTMAERLESDMHFQISFGIYQTNLYHQPTYFCIVYKDYSPPSYFCTIYRSSFFISSKTFEYNLESAYKSFLDSSKLLEDSIT
jgi:hypothetical protein